MAWMSEVTWALIAALTVAAVGVAMELIARREEKKEGRAVSVWGQTDFWRGR